MVVVQADGYNQQLPHVVVAEVTKNLTMKTGPACLFIDLSTAEGKATGLLNDSVVNCLLLASVNADRIDPVIGQLAPALLQKLDGCLGAALALP